MELPGPSNPTNKNKQTKTNKQRSTRTARTARTHARTHARRVWGVVTHERQYAVCIATVAWHAVSARYVRLVGVSIRTFAVPCQDRFMLLVAHCLHAACCTSCAACRVLRAVCCTSCALHVGCCTFTRKELLFVSATCPSLHAGCCVLHGRCAWWMKRARGFIASQSQGCTAG